MTGPERRRRWGPADRRQILIAAFAPGAIVADVSQQFEISTSLIYKWRREVMAARAEGQFVPAVIVDGPLDVECAARSEPAVASTIRARQTCFWGLLRSSTIACRRLRSVGLRWTVTPVRIPQTRTTLSP